MRTSLPLKSEQVEELKQDLRNREWRLNNLYWIKDPDGKRILYRLNWAQKILIGSLWFLNIILKVRQVGITTFFCILYLDDVIFNGLDAGLIAHTLQDAQRIFDTKVKYAWDNLPEAVRDQFIVNADNVRELKFTRKIDGSKSMIYVGTSLRSGTVQRLHISELGTIDQKYPDKAQEIQAGALNTVHKGQIVTIESTAKGQMGIFYDMCQTAMDFQRMGKQLTEMDYRFFFFPWYRHPEYQLEGKILMPREIKEYFRKIEIGTGIKLTQQQKNWYFKKKQVMQDVMSSEFPSTPEEAFRATIEGSYYGKQLDRMMEEGRITKVPYLSLLPVDTWWDLGVQRKKTDATSIIFTQDVGLEIHLIDYYGSSGEGLAHYVKILKEKPYVYGRHWAPHDIEVQELGTGKSRYETAASLGLRFDVVPKLPFSDGIDAARMIFSSCWADEEKCSHLIRALKAYRKEWDDKLGRFKNRPLKNWAADPADAFRMMALGHRDLQKFKPYDSEEEEIRDLRARKELRGRHDPLNPFSM